MADPLETAQRVLVVQVKSVQKDARTIFKFGKKLLQKLPSLRDGFKFLASKIRMIQGFIPGAIVKRIKAAFAFLNSSFGILKRVLGELNKWMNVMFKIAKQQMTKKLKAVWKKVVLTLDGIFKLFRTTLFNFIKWLKKIMKMLPTLSQAADAIGSVITNIRDIIKKIFMAVPLLTIATTLKNLLERIFKRVKDTKDNAVDSVIKMMETSAAT